MTQALVLGGGGFAASAWEIGLLAGMASAGVDFRNSDLFIGTSSGARVALHLASDADLTEIYQQHLMPLQNLPPTPKPDWASIRPAWTQAKRSGGSTDAILGRIGALALKHASQDPEDRRVALASQIPILSWPPKPISIVAVNADTGHRRVFDKNSGVSLVDAMMATTAFFGWAPALIEGHRYIDGGFYSSNNADVALGFDEVVILALRSPLPLLSMVSLEYCVGVLRAGGARVTVIQPDADCEAAFASAGGVSVRGPAARAGYKQGGQLVR